MKAPTLFSITWACVACLQSGCVYTRQITYDPQRMGTCAAQTGCSLRTGRPLPKSAVTALLAGTNFVGLDPVQFSLDADRVGRVFGQGRAENFSFVVISDLQIEDRSLRFNPLFTRFLDKHPMEIETTVRGFYQDHADVFYSGFLLKAIREGLQLNTNIDFVIHLGDAMQIGTKAELATFNEVTGKFLVAGHAPHWEECWTGTWLQTPVRLEGDREIPFFNVLGNHDVLTTGNFDGKMPLLVPGGRVTSLEKLRAFLQEVPPFSTPRCERATVLGTGTEAHGYYLVDRQLPDGKKVRLIMLNTNERNLLDPVYKFERGALYPSLSSDQFEWLQTALRGAQADDSVTMVLVFGHNQLAEITVNRTGKRKERDASFGQVKELLGKYGKVKAYFCGHLHSGSPPKEHRFGNHMVVEYICPSAQEFPKSFGVVTVRKDLLGDYAITVSYRNLEDLMDLDRLPAVEVQDDTAPYDQQTRFANWLAELNRTTEDAVERLQILAKYSYFSAIYDLARDLRNDISLCFNPKFAGQLLKEYSGAQDLWLQLKHGLTWNEIRVALENSPASTPVVAISQVSMVDAKEQVTAAEAAKK